jgi:hypothetical protein
MTLLADLEEFVHNHRPHGRITSDATEPTRNGYLLTVACACGVVFERWVTQEDADLDLFRLASRTERAFSRPERDEHWLGPHTVARDGAGGVGGAEIGLMLARPVRCADVSLVVPEFEAALVHANRSPILGADQAQ